MPDEILGCLERDEKQRGKVISSPFQDEILIAEGKHSWINITKVSVGRRCLHHFIAVVEGDMCGEMLLMEKCHLHMYLISA